ncbi:hypothetical protein SPRG_17470, partial [Saprolegnia parasitica CBS 223.65]
SIDIPSVTLTALDFKKPFALRVAKDGLLHGFVSSFDIRATPTHWQQTFFHLSKPFHVKAGDAIAGTWAVRRNALNPRFLDVDFEWTHGPHKFFEKFSIH